MSTSLQVVDMHGGEEVDEVVLDLKLDSMRQLQDIALFNVVSALSGIARGCRVHVFVRCLKQADIDVWWSCVEHLKSLTLRAYRATKWILTQ